MKSNISEIRYLNRLALVLGASYIHLNRPKLAAAQLIAVSSVDGLTDEDRLFEEALIGFDALAEDIAKDATKSVGLDSGDRPALDRSFDPGLQCTNPGADPQHNAWSGIHTRLSAEIISRQQRVDGVMIWDMACGTVGRPCPKLAAAADRATAVAHYMLPPPCIYVMPATIASPRNNPRPVAQSLDDVHLLKAFHECFHGKDEEVNYVDFEVEHQGAETMRKTRIRRAGGVVQESKLTAIQRV